MKNRYTPAYPIFVYIKVGFKGVYITWTCFPDVDTRPHIKIIQWMNKTFVQSIFSIPLHVVVLPFSMAYNIKSLNKCVQNTYIM